MSDERRPPTPSAASVTPHNNAGVARLLRAFGAHSLQADVRHDDNSAYGGNTTGRLGYAFEVVPGLKLRALAGTSFRAPTFNDLAFPGFGVPTIRPERGRSIEAGVAWQGVDATRARPSTATVARPDRLPARSHVLSSDPAYDFGCAANVQRALLRGATLAASERWRPRRARERRLPRRHRRRHRRSPAAPRRAPGKRSAPTTLPACGASVAALLFVGSRPDAGSCSAATASSTCASGGSRSLRGASRPSSTTRSIRQVEPVRDYRGLGRPGVARRALRLCGL
jgi:vitamin B12 transporter